ncbi:MAG: ABC transporter ATP-binding protein [Candidatus Methanoliparum thermophilum]|uniref:ABC transporter ATP-binding protein n=1 Tax=Methanoliparum thermophilum TaxID=2491083 RepID=A0A520KUL2_METT2|nr:ABC transporter ATP-binding protein [Candidatus Methanoliparum sp. LAM-1]RZN65391.1 MAG: ABC transporter ATP-binding protein [Candidatus Methanoliparum thermophilum]BDC35521.1 macrolide ABC transporter ATP-binding protein [Candidatus Methanoliparum sp. LAM-1]
MIETRNLTKIYRRGNAEVVGLKDINLKIEDGEFLSVIGPSGSGKSTLLHLLGGLDKPTYGEVLIDGENIEDLEEKELCQLRRDKIGFVFQDFNLINTLNAIENVVISRIPTGVPHEMIERGINLLSYFRMEDRLDHLPTQISGGQQQKVAIARALINMPQIVLADEPTGELDSKSGGEIIRLMREMNEIEGVTFVIVTHDLNVSDQTDRIIQIQDGEIIKDINNTPHG